MVYTGLAALIAIVAAAVLLLAGKLMLRRHWFLGWLRGMSGVLLLAVTALLAFSALDFYSYRQLSKEQAVATLSFSQLSDQHYQVSLVDSEGEEQRLTLAGDLWQLDARVLKWHTGLAALGLTAGYRLDRLSGRYYSLEQERSKPRTLHQLGNNSNLLDLWGWFRDYGGPLGIVDASYGSATYLPMSDGALFSVTLSSTGLLARPLNDRAKAAVNSWQ